jgi:hypothetical protein
MLLSLFIRPSFEHFEELTEDQKTKLKYADKFIEFCMFRFLRVNRDQLATNGKFEQYAASQPYYNKMLLITNELGRDALRLLDYQTMVEGLFFGATPQQIIDKAINRNPKRYNWISNELMETLPYERLANLTYQTDFDYNRKYVDHKSQLYFPIGSIEAPSKVKLDYADALIKLIVYTWISSFLEQTKTSNSYDLKALDEIYYKKWSDVGVVDEDYKTMGVLPQLNVSTAILGDVLPSELITKTISDPNRYKYISQATMDRIPLDKIQEKLKEYASQIKLDVKYARFTDGKLRILTPTYSEYVSEAIRLKVCVWVNTAANLLKQDGKYDSNKHSTLYETKLKELVIGTDEKLVKLLTFQDISTKIFNGQKPANIIENTIENTGSLYDRITDITVDKLPLEQLKKNAKDFCSSVDLTVRYVNDKNQFVGTSTGTVTTTVASAPVKATTTATVPTTTAPPTPIKVTTATTTLATTVPTTTVPSTTAPSTTVPTTTVPTTTVPTTTVPTTTVPTTTVPTTTVPSTTVPTTTVPTTTVPSTTVPSTTVPSTTVPTTTVPSTTVPTTTVPTTTTAPMKNWFSYIADVFM